jgi:hypothetical protein
VKASNLFPSKDLLDQIGGIEDGLRRKRRLGQVGLVGLALSALQIAVLAGTSDWWATLTNLSWGTLAENWLVIVPPVLFALATTLFVAGRFWLRESRQPFRYTCQVAEFTPVSPTPGGVLPWLRHDLTQRLNDRIGRLEFVDAEPESAEDCEAHIQIEGEYLIRKEDPELPGHILEVTPRVRIGGTGAPATLSHPVRFELSEGYEVIDEAQPAGGLDEAVDDGRDDEQTPIRLLRHEDYSRVLERVYFSVATRLYQQIRQDVQRKIDLLPTPYLRATAYLYEADDYAKSTTLDAYDEAAKLFERAMLLYDPFARRLPAPGWRRLLWYTRLFFSWIARTLRFLGSLASVRLGKRELLLARAEIGYASMVLYRRVLADMAGARLNPIFEARPIAMRAEGRIGVRARRRPDRADLREALFAARVTVALAWAYLESHDRAERKLEEARALSPELAQQDPRYLFTAALIETTPRTKLGLLRRAAERDPRFEPARYRLARETELLWRRRRSFERTAAQTVFDEYRAVMELNPGNIRVWANLGYMHWLQHQGVPAAIAGVELPRHDALYLARKAYERGREYKQIKQETFVAGLDYGLARVAAEEGRIGDAYRHYIAAVSAKLAQGVEHELSAQSDDFDLIGDSMVERFERYVEQVEDSLNENQASGHPESNRIRDSVNAFVWNDYGEACVNYYNRTGDTRKLSIARRSYRTARQLNPDYSLPHFNLALLAQHGAKYEKARRYLERVRDLEPHWPDGRLVWIRLRTYEAFDWLLELRNVRDRIARLDSELEPPGSFARVGWQLRRVGRAFTPLATGASATLEYGADLVRTVRRSGDPANPAEHVLEWRTGASRYVSAGDDSGPADSDERRVEELRLLKARRDQLEDALRMGAEEAGAHLRALVPHEWLWTDEGAFAWDALERRDLSRDLVWERELNDLHVTALLTYGTSLVFGALGPPPRRILGRRPSEDAERLDSLFRTLESHFWPDQSTLLLAWRALSSDDRFNDRIQRSVVRGLAGDPARVDKLMWLEQEVVAPEERCRAYERALREASLARTSLGWLAERLEKAGDWAASLEAYERALSAEGPSGPLHEGDLPWQLGRVRAEWALGRYEDALGSLAWLEEQRPKAEGWRTHTAAAIAALERGDQEPDSGARIARLVGWLDDACRGARGRDDTAAVGDAAEATLVIATERYRDQAPRRVAPVPTDDSVEAVPAFLPVALEIDRQAFGEAGETDMITSVIGGYAAIQGETAARTGLSIQDIHIRANDWFNPGDFVVRINGFPLVARRTGLEPGGVLAEEILAALEDAVLHEPWRLLTLDRLQALLARWAGPSRERLQLVDQAVGSDADRVRLLRALRALVEDGGTVTDLGPILRVLSRDEFEHKTPTELAHEFRIVLEERLLAQDGFELSVLEDGRWSIQPV